MKYKGIIIFIFPYLLKRNKQIPKRSLSNRAYMKDYYYRDFNVLVIGLGFVGLPDAPFLASRVVSPLSRVIPQFSALAAA